MFANIKSCLVSFAFFALSHNETSVLCPRLFLAIYRVHRCLSRGPTAESTWEAAANLITGETGTGLDPQLIMNLSPQLAAPKGSKINQVNHFLRSDFKKSVNIYLNINVS